MRSLIESVYLLELAGEDDDFAAREAASIASAVSRPAVGLATARGIDRERVRGLAYTHRVSSLLGYADPTIEGARTLIEAATVDREGTVAVRARDVRGRTGVDTQRVERELGAVLVERGFTVDLDAPDHELRAVFAPSVDRSGSEGTTDGERYRRERPERGSESGAGICALGWLAAESVRDFGARAPTRKPFFQPGSMDPLLARALANIVGAGPGRTILDPMCGTGGILVEAGLIGACVVGADAQSKMVRGARRNLAYYLDGNGNGGESERESTGGFAVLQGEATRIPLHDGTVDGICFDVPYGRQSKITGDLDALVGGALTEGRRLAPRAVVVGDRPWAGAAREAGWVVESTFERRVHRSLIRHIAVLERD